MTKFSVILDQITEQSDVHMYVSKCCLCAKFEWNSCHRFTVEVKIPILTKNDPKIQSYWIKSQKLCDVNMQVSKFCLCAKFEWNSCHLFTVEVKIPILTQNDPNFGFAGSYHNVQYVKSLNVVYMASFDGQLFSSNWNTCIIWSRCPITARGLLHLLYCWSQIPWGI